MCRRCILIRVSLLEAEDVHLVVLLTFIGVEVVDVKVEVGAITESAHVDYVSLELKDGDTSAIKGHSLHILLVFEPEENGRRHG